MVRKMLKRGFLTSSMMYLMLAHTEEHVGAMLSALDEVLEEIAAIAEAGQVKEEAGDVPVASSFARLN
jgi:hypothetical protein